MGQNYLYELHMHTSQASACGVLTGREQADQYLAAGYTGIVITDHFFNGNTCVPKNLPWEERIEIFMSGYRDAKRRGDEIGLQVFFGLEVNFGGPEFLLYGVGEEFLLANPKMLSYSPEELYRRVKKAGGYMVQAHPYRDASYISEIHLYPNCCDAVEVRNLGNRDACNVWASHYATRIDKPRTAGSDCHTLGRYGAGVRLSKKVDTVEELLEAILAREVELVPGELTEGYSEDAVPFGIPIILHE